MNGESMEKLCINNGLKVISTKNSRGLIPVRFTVLKNCNWLQLFKIQDNFIYL